MCIRDRYNTMLYLVQTNYTDAIAKGSDVLFVAGAISMGVLVVTSLFKTMNPVSYTHLIFYLHLLC